MQTKFERDLIIAMLAFAICVPNVFIFLESLLKSVFGNKAWPTFASIFVVSTATHARTHGHTHAQQPHTHALTDTHIHARTHSQTRPHTHAHTDNTHTLTNTHTHTHKHVAVICRQALARNALAT